MVSRIRDAKRFDKPLQADTFFFVKKTVAKGSNWEAAGMRDVVIVSAVRTAIGGFSGTLAGVSPWTWGPRSFRKRFPAPA